MKVYVAAKFEKKAEVLAAYEKLKELGHTISYDWTTHKPIKPYNENPEMARVYAKNELEGIANSGAFICMPDEKGTTLFIECGAAIMASLLKKDCAVYVVGKENGRSPWFFLPNVKRVDTLDDALADLGPAKKD